MTQPAQQEFELTRTFDAPRELVFKAWTEPERLNQWWPRKTSPSKPPSSTCVRAAFFITACAPPDGRDMWSKFVYREIVPPSARSFVNSFSDPAGNLTRNPWNPPSRRKF